MTRAQSVLLGLGIVGAGIGLIILMALTQTEPPKKPPVDNSPLVEVIQPQAETIRFTVDANGVVEPRTETSLVSEVSGVVLEVAEQYVAGGYFAKGDVVLQIDPTDYQVAVEQSRARLLSAEAQLLQEEARTEQAKKEWQLTGKKLSDAPTLALRTPFLAEAKANVASAQADLKNARQKLSRTTIRAPYDGMVKSKNVDVGQFINIGTQLGVTFATDYAEVRLPLTDRDLAFIDAPGPSNNSEINQGPEVLINGTFAGQTVQWPARLVRMEGVLDTQSRTHYAVARINDPYSLTNPSTEALPPLKMGSFVTASIQGIEVPGLYKIPRDAFRGMDQVLVSDAERTLQIRTMEIIRADQDTMYVKSGLEEGDQVIVTAMEAPISGMKLRIQGEPLPEAEQLPEQNELQQSAEIVSAQQ